MNISIILNFSKVTVFRLSTSLMTVKTARKIKQTK